MTTHVLMTQTLPTIVGIGVTAQTIETMFGKKANMSDTNIVAVAQTKSQADEYVRRYKNALKKQGKPYINRIKYKKVKGGYVIIHYGGE